MDAAQPISVVCIGCLQRVYLVVGVETSVILCPPSPNLVGVVGRRAIRSVNSSRGMKNCCLVGVGSIVGGNRFCCNRGVTHKRVDLEVKLSMSFYMEVFLL
jgi:hypothetical protein